jgi:hypothetical protein
VAAALIDGSMPFDLLAIPDRPVLLVEKLYINSVHPSMPNYGAVNDVSFRKSVPALAPKRTERSLPPDESSSFFLFADGRCGLYGQSSARCSVSAGCWV